MGARNDSAVSFASARNGVSQSTRRLDLWRPHVRPNFLQPFQ
jgi:hypothetical protein